MLLECILLLDLKFSSFKISVEPTIQSLTVNNDLDGNTGDSEAILVEGNDYTFTCEVKSDPHVDIIWSVLGNFGNPNNPIPRYDETDMPGSVESMIDCDTGDPGDGVNDDSYSETLVLNSVTLAELQFAVVSCSVGAQEEMLIYLQILRKLLDS